MDEADCDCVCHFSLHHSHNLFALVAARKVKATQFRALKRRGLFVHYGAHRGPDS
jgi:hypothetical protein